MRNFGVEKNPGKQNNLREKRNTKTRVLDSKYNQKKHIPDTIHGINIADQVIPTDFSSVLLTSVAHQNRSDGSTKEQTVAH